MKHLFLSLLLAATCTTAASAQGARIGVKAGPTLSNFAGKSIDTDYRLAGHAGLVVDCGLSELLSVQPELLFSMKGDKRKDVDGTARTHLSYLDLPVLLKVKAGGLFFEAGPQVGLLLSAKNKINDLSFKNSYYKTLDVGYAVGVGYQVESGLNVGVRYNRGLRDMANFTGTETIDLRFPPFGRNSSFQFYVGYLLPEI